MKLMLLICGGLLLLAVAPLPIGYYTFLRISITIGAIGLITSEIEEGVNIWIISFGIIVIVFNPIFPIYLHDKDIWIPIDIIAALFFFAKSFFTKTN